MENHRIEVVYQKGLQTELDAVAQRLCDQAKLAAKRAYAPYSNFSVGAALLLDNEEIVTGNNQENAAYPSGLCAERVAMFYANSLYPDAKVVRMVVFVDIVEEADLVPPCGSCLQVIRETEVRFEQSVEIILIDHNRFLRAESVQQFMPLSFSSNFLLSKNNN